MSDAKVAKVPKKDLKEEKFPEDGEAHGFAFGRAELTFLVSESICILFYGLFTEFGEYTSPLSGDKENDKANEFL
jgi:hypothetical protein